MDAADKIFAGPFLGFFPPLGFWEATKRDREKPANEGQHEKTWSSTAANHIYDLYVTVFKGKYERNICKGSATYDSTSTIVNNKSPIGPTKLVWLGGEKNQSENHTGFCELERFLKDFKTKRMQKRFLLRQRQTNVLEKLRPNFKELSWPIS